LGRIDWKAKKDWSGVGKNRDLRNLGKKRPEGGNGAMVHVGSGKKV